MRSRIDSCTAMASISADAERFLVGIEDAKLRGA
jgi:hypothetical protein